jgi:DNA-directed RNA polymerase specialized sigma24 family protein
MFKKLRKSSLLTFSVGLRFGKTKTITQVAPMSRPDVSFPSAEEGLSLHLRLCDLDPAAPADVCRAYLGPLVGWIAVKYPHIDPSLHETAVHEALFTYVQKPLSFDPRRGSLAAYLRMAAQGDLLNLLRAEQRHHRQRLPWPVVEESTESGNLLGREEEPPLTLQRDEEAKAWQSLLHSVEERCTPEEKCVLDLMLAGEQSTVVFAEALGLSGLPMPDQKRHVKRVKDRIKKRLERGAPRHD